MTMILAAAMLAQYCVVAWLAARMRDTEAMARDTLRAQQELAAQIKQDRAITVLCELERRARR